MLSGALFPLAYPKFDLFPLAFVVLAPLFYIAEAGRGRQAFLCGLLAGFLTNFIGYRFLAGTLHRFGGFSAPLAHVGLVLLAAYQGARTAVWIYLISVARRRSWPLWLAAPVVEVGLELIFPYLFLSHHGSAMYRFLPYIQIADLFGVYGVSAALVLGNVLVYELASVIVLQRSALRLVPTLGLAAVQAIVLGYGVYRIKEVKATAAASPSKRIGLIQPSIQANEKNYGLNRAPERLDPHVQIERQLELSRQIATSSDLILWPEATYPSQVYRSAARLTTLSVHRGYAVPVLFGALTSQPVRGAATEHYNSAILVDKDDQILGRYDKNFLVWFSESLPFSEVFPILERWFQNAHRLKRGAGAAVIPWEGYYIAPSICNDDIIPAYTLRLAGQPANLLVNLTDDAWFANTAEPYFHLALSTFRAVESHLYLVRDTNSGVSSLIDASGRIIEQTKVTVDTQEPLARAWEVKMMPARETVYRRVGNLFAYLCLALAAMTTLLRRRHS
ncbi:MAG TPA: apolipoprotein N-acyltransferase [Pseudomonadota bacterium]|nr:apolipoprotein N-acyltransferase [Pseudomonadota bacterium]